MSNMVEFIFMLTHRDITIPNALEVFEEIKDTGLKFIGCKDIGLSLDKMKELFSRMQKADITTFLEVVTYSEEEHFRGVDIAMTVKADYLIGGMPWFFEKTKQYLQERKADIKYFPYIGKIEDHPCVLKGSLNEIIENGLKFEEKGVDGINLLLYRYLGDQDKLLDIVTERLHVPLIVAGSIDNFQKIEKLKKKNKNIWAFTVGGAIFEKKFIKDGAVRDQVISILDYIKK
ncbi:MAG: hypothetical protein QXK88_07150 [Desulfurococcaceae archaeon]